MILLEVMSSLRKSIEESVEACQRFCNVEFEIPKINLEFPELKIHGELSTNAALVFSKKFSLTPIALADIMLKNFNKPEYIEDIRVELPGFINFFLSKSFFKKVLLDIDENLENYTEKNKKNKKILVEFVSANPTGPMHIGNARLGALGDSLSEVLKFAGFDVYREFYVNDAGNQIKKFAESLAARYVQIFDPTAKFPEDGYHGNDIKELADKFEKVHGSSYSNCDRKILEKTILDYALPKNIKNMKLNLMRYKVRYDNWFHESSLYDSGEIYSVLNKLKDGGATYTMEGALWFRATAFGAQKDEVLVRSNGIPTYFAADIAYHVNKFLVRKFDICVDFLGADHQGHIPRMRAAMKFFDIDDSRLKFIIVQLVRIVKGGEVVKMSKRLGKAETLEDFIEQISVDCSRFIFNMQDANSAMDFDVNNALANDSNNPSYYVKYAYVRIQSILKKFSEIPDKKRLNLELLDSEFEHKLIFEISKFPYIISEVADLMNPTLLARYAVNLASVFHKFYNADKVKNESVSLSNARHFLCLQTAKIIKIILKILKMDILEGM